MKNTIQPFCLVKSGEADRKTPLREDRIGDFMGKALMKGESPTVCGVTATEYCGCVSKKIITLTEAQCPG